MPNTEPEWRVIYVPEVGAYQVVNSKGITAQSVITTMRGSNGKHWYYFWEDDAIARANYMNRQEAEIVSKSKSGQCNHQA